MQSQQIAVPAMNLQQLLAPWFAGAPAIEVTGLCLDNRTIRAGQVFIAIQGHHHDGRLFIADAISKGAVAVIADAGDSNVPFKLSSDLPIPVISFPHLKSHLSALAARFYQQPSAQLQVIGVTGTNGKTTVSQLIAQWIDLLGAKAAVMGTTGNGFLPNLNAAENTTGNPIEIQQQLSDFLAHQATHVAMEVSSHGLVQDRVKAVKFAAAVFTNLSRDHLDYHGTMQAYAEAKQRLFSHYGAPVSVINADDAIGASWLKGMPDAIGVAFKAENLQSHTGRQVTLKAAQYATSGIDITFDSSWGAGSFHAPLVGEFNVMNLLLALATLLGLGFALDALLRTAPKLRPVVGRMEVFSRPSRPMLVVDYAHTPDALEKALSALRVHCTGQLWCVFGCGGDRDTGKRPMMAAIAERLADKVVLTDDNPRTEAPVKIINEMLKGIKHPAQVNIIHDRTQACRFAFEHASSQDVILIAGKGHEDYQVLASGTISYSDRTTVKSLLESAG